MPRVKYRKHNDQIRELQDRFHEGDHRALEEMYEVLRIMGERMVRRYFANKKKRVPEELIQERGHDMAAEQISRFLYIPGYRMKTPSGIMRNGPFLRFMFRDKHHDHMVSLEEYLTTIHEREESNAD